MRKKGGDICLDEMGKINWKEGESHGILSTGPVRLDKNLSLDEHF